MRKGHTSFDLELEETSNIAYLGGQMLLAVLKQGRELITNVNSRLGLHPLHLSASYRLAVRVCC